MSGLLGTTLTNASAIDRNSTDFYPTPPDVTYALADYLDLQNRIVWEPACGAGHMSRALSECGAIVHSTDLHDQGFGVDDVDFLTAELRDCDWIITNPPFKLAEQFIRRCIEHEKPFAMLLKSQYWHSSRRRPLFESHRPHAVLPLTWRPDFHFGAKGGSPTMEVCWTVWHAQPADHTIYMPIKRRIAAQAEFEL